MKIYMASVNLGDKPEPRKPPQRLFSYWELKDDLFGAFECFQKIIEHNKKEK